MNPWDKHVKERGLEGRLKRLDRTSQISVAAACLERSLPIYLQWANRYDPETAQEAIKGLELLWQFSRGEKAPGRGRTFEMLCEHDPEETDDSVPVDWASPRGWEALRLALQASLQQESADLIEMSMEASYQVVERPLVEKSANQLADEASALELARDDRVKAEIAFQEATLTEVETTGKPLTRDRALEISRRYRTGVQREI